MERPPRPYGHVAWCYDVAASAYSMGAIGRAKGWHVGRLRPGDRVLYVGAGTGREVAAACAVQPQVEVVCVEPCAAMARRLRRRLSPWTGQVTTVEEPLRAAEGEGASGGFDWVCGHFFFNVFEAEAMPGVLAMAASHVKPGGRMVVADFAATPSTEDSRLRRDGRQDACPTQDSASFTDWCDRFVRELYYRPVNVAGRALRMCALHPIYDYARLLVPLRFEVEERVGLSLVPGSPALYEVICARKEQGG